MTCSESQSTNGYTSKQARKNYRRLTVVPVLGNSSIRSSHSVSPPGNDIHSASVFMCDHRERPSSRASIQIRTHSHSGHPTSARAHSRS